MEVTARSIRSLMPLPFYHRIDGTLISFALVDLQLRDFDESE